MNYWLLKDCTWLTSLNTHFILPYVLLYFTDEIKETELDLCSKEFKKIIYEKGKKKLQSYAKFQGLTVVKPC